MSMTWRAMYVLVPAQLTVAAALPEPVLGFGEAQSCRLFEPLHRQCGDVAKSREWRLRCARCARPILILLANQILRLRVPLNRGLAPGPRISSCGSSS